MAAIEATGLTKSKLGPPHRQSPCSAYHTTRKPPESHVTPTMCTRPQAYRRKRMVWRVGKASGEETEQRGSTASNGITRHPPDRHIWVRANRAVKIAKQRLKLFKNSSQYKHMVKMIHPVLSIPEDDTASDKDANKRTHTTTNRTVPLDF